MRRAVVVAKGVVAVVAGSLAVIRFVAIDSGSHSASGTIGPWVGQVALIAVGAAVLWIALDKLARRAERRTPIPR